MAKKSKSKLLDGQGSIVLPDANRAIEDIYEEIRDVYQTDDRPWVIGYSGGKDSSTTLQLIWYALSKLPKSKLKKPVYVISSDTLVETPHVISFIDQTLDNITSEAEKQGLPFEAHKVQPIIEESFWVNLIGRGYPTPSITFRWCTERMKIKPADRFIMEKVSKHGEVVVVLGVRKGESATRDQVINLHQIKGTILNRHTRFSQAYVYTPVVDFSVEDIWMYLSLVKNPWGGDNQELIDLYKASQAGECPLVVDDSTPSCGNSRFGCWTCTVVGKDKTMESLSGTDKWLKPLLKYRNFLAETLDPERKKEVRNFKRAKGQVTLKHDKSAIVRGPYKLSFCEELLEELLKTQEQVRLLSGDPEITLIYNAELHEIRRIWRLEKGDWQDRVPRIYKDVTGKDLAWVDDDGAAFNYNDYKMLEKICEKHDVPTELVVRLIEVERATMGMTRRSSVYQRLTKILAEEWRSEEEVMESLKDEFEV